MLNEDVVVRPVWARSEDELHESFRKMKYAFVAYNNCSNLLQELFTALYVEGNAHFDGNIFLSLNPVFTSVVIDSKSGLFIRNFSNELNEVEEIRKSCPYMVFRARIKPMGNSFVDHKYFLDFCEYYKRPFSCRTMTNTCPVKWAYENGVDAEPAVQDACIVDRILNGRSVTQQELKVFHDKPISVRPTIPLCESNKLVLTSSGLAHRILIPRNHEYRVELYSEYNDGKFLFEF